MPWTGPMSAIFTQAALNPILGRFFGSTVPTGFTSFSADTINAALYGNTGTPNKDDTLANTAYGAGQWIVGNEMTGTGYTAGGAALGTKAISSATGAVNFTAANQQWTTVTLSGTYGDLVYDNSITGGTVAKQGLCCHYFGGSQSVTAGTFTIAWNSGNVMQFTFAYA